MDLVLRMLPAGVGLLIDRLDPHQSHQPAHPLTADLMALAAQPRRHPARTVERRPQVLLVDPPHQVQIGRVGRDRLVVHARTGHAQQLALARHRQRAMPAIDHRQPRRPAHGAGLRRKKSRSTVNCPIFSYNSDTLGPSACSGVALPASNTPDAPSSRAFFQAWIWLECTPNRLDSSATVASPFRAARATFALNSAVCRLRVCFMSCSLYSATYRSGTLSSPSVRKTGTTSLPRDGEPVTSSRWDSRDEAFHSAACGPQPKAAIPRWSGFDLESQDLHPDDRVNHSDGAAMNGFVDLHGESITGVINTFDRVIFKGHLNGFFPDGAFGRYLSRRGILLKDAGRFFEAETQRIRDHVVSLAAAAGRPVEYLAGASTHRSGTSKEARARAIAERDGVTEGLVCVLSVLEPCRSFAVAPNRQTRRLEVRPHKCLHYYLYRIDPEFGWMHVRLQTWAPYEIQVYVNGREWLARQLDAAAIGYRRSDNKIIAVDDPAAVAALGERVAHTHWAPGLERQAGPGQSPPPALPTPR